LWDCSWKPNPFYKYYFPWSLIRTFTDVTQKKCKISTQLLVFITAPKIPKDLTCLQDCFPTRQLKLMKKAVKAIKSKRQEDLAPCAGNSTYWFPTSLDPKLDYFIAKFSAFRSNGQINENLNNDLPNETQDQNTFFNDKLPDAEYTNNYTSFMRATNPFELSLEICAFARFLKQLNKYDYDYDYYYSDYKDGIQYDLFGDKTCDDFLQNVTVPTVQSRKKKKSFKTTTKAFGPTTADATVNRYPWLCSLKEAGFRGRHRCGVTLLSGPPDPILVSAAHCNYVCKDNTTMQIQEICCCRQASDQASCRQDSSYCTNNAQLTKALPQEMQIVCGEHSLEEQPEKFSIETEIILDIQEIVNHEGYSPGEPGERKGPYLGKDIAVYKVNSRKFYDEKGESRLKRKVLYPAIESALSQ